MARSGFLRTYLSQCTKVAKFQRILHNLIFSEFAKFFEFCGANTQNFGLALKPVWNVV